MKLIINYKSQDSQSTLQLFRQRNTSGRKPRLKIFKKDLLMTNSVVKEVFLLPQLANPFFDFKGFLTMCNPFESLMVNNALSRKRFIRIQRSLLFLDLSNLLGKFIFFILIVTIKITMS